MDGRPTWRECDEAGDYVVPNVLSPRDLASGPDKMDETVPHTNMLFEIKPNLRIIERYQEFFDTDTRKQVLKNV